MFKHLFQASDLLDVPVLVMLFFLGVFGAVLFRVLSRRRQSHYRAMARLPLELGEDT